MAPDRRCARENCGALLLRCPDEDPPYETTEAWKCSACARRYAIDPDATEEAQVAKTENPGKCGWRLCKDPRADGSRFCAVHAAIKADQANGSARRRGVARVAHAPAPAAEPAEPAERAVIDPPTAPRPGVDPVIEIRRRIREELMLCEQRLERLRAADQALAAMG